MSTAIPGNLHVANDVLADIVGNAAMECYGVVGMTAEKANKTLADAGFNIRITGNPRGGTVATHQSVQAGTVAERGTIITVEFRHIATD
jgi:uncharacterized alkaline shock family protein YloU